MNMQNLMAQAQRMQRDIQKKKDEIDKMSFESENELVKVVFNGKKEMVSIKIKGNIDESDVEVLEDMIVLASKEAIKKVDKEIENKLGAYGSGLSGLF